MAHFLHRYLGTYMTNGQTKSKGLFSSGRFFQKTNKGIRLYYYDTSGRLVFVRFQEEIEDRHKKNSKLTDLQYCYAYAQCTYACKYNELPQDITSSFMK